MILWVGQYIYLAWKEGLIFIFSAAQYGTGRNIKNHRAYNSLTTRSFHHFFRGKLLGDKVIPEYEIWVIKNLSMDTLLTGKIRMSDGEGKGQSIGF